MICAELDEQVDAMASGRNAEVLSRVMELLKARNIVQHVADASDRKVLDPNTFEPICFHSSSSKRYTELIEDLWNTHGRKERVQLRKLGWQLKAEMEMTEPCGECSECVKYNRFSQ